MTLSVLKHNAIILLEVSKNYGLLIKKRNVADKKDLQRIDYQIKLLRRQFLYLIASIDRIVKKEKNAN